MSVSTPTHSVSTKLTPMFGKEFQVSITLPKERPLTDIRTKIPISLHLSKVGVETVLGCYVYTIPAKIINKAHPFHQTLLNNSEETLVDMTKRIGGLISKKYNVPSYVSLSGPWILDDLMSTVQELILFIESQWDSSI